VKPHHSSIYAEFGCSGVVRRAWGTCADMDLSIVDGAALM